LVAGLGGGTLLAVRSRTADSAPSAEPAVAGGVAEAESPARSALIMSYRASSGAGREPVLGAG